jgi:hypothetical protein
MGFGNDRAPGVVITLEDGQWQTLAAPRDMLFPTSMGLVTGGENDGTHLVLSSTYNESRLHAVDAEGNARNLGQFDGWGYMTVDHEARVAYVATEAGQVFWSGFDDLTNWERCVCADADGNVLEGIGRAGELRVHPGSGKVILPAADGGHIGNNQPTEQMGTTIYAAEIENGTPVFRQVGRIEDAGLWELRTAAVGNEMYLGTGVTSSLEQDAAPGGIYRISADGGLRGTGAGPHFSIETAGSNAPDGLDAPNGTGDAVHPDRIRWHNAPEAADWPVVTDLSIDFGEPATLFHHNADWNRTFPLSGKDLAGNIWVGTKDSGGEWNMCPFEWFLPGQNYFRTGSAAEYGGHLVSNMTPPGKGEEVLFMVSTPAKGPQRTDNERSRIIKTTWP